MTPEQENVIDEMDKKKPGPRFWRGINHLIYSLPLLLTGCASLKKAGLIGTTSLGVASVTSAFSSGVTVPLLAGAATASVTSVIADQRHSSPTTEGGSPMSNNCAPDNFWTLLGDLVGMGGWLLILVIIIPMILGWMLPGPLERKKKSASS